MSFVTEFSRVEQYQSGKVRQLLRHAALNALSTRQLLTGSTAQLKKPRVQFLYIHHCFEDEVLPFNRLMQHLSKWFVFIPYSEAVQRVQSGDIDQPYLAFSSDDGLRNNLDAAKVLEKYDATACFFLNPALIGEQDFTTIQQHCAEQLHFPPVEFLDWDQVAALQNRGHEIGAHTLRHMNMAQADAEEIESDLQQCREILHQHCGEIKHFAFPYGRLTDFNETARKLVFESGFESCASAERGCHVPIDQQLNNDQICLRRDHILLKWPWNHIRYFLINNAKQAGFSDYQFPYSP